MSLRPNNQYDPLAVFPNGVPTVPPPPTSRIRWGRATNGGVRAEIVPPPGQDEPTHSPGRSLAAIREVNTWLRGGSAEQPPGQNVRATQERYAQLIGPDRAGRPAHVVAVATQSVARLIACEAAVTLDRSTKQRRKPNAQTAATSVWSRADIPAALMRNGVKPCFTDVDPDTGCTSADRLAVVIDADTELVLAPCMYGQAPDVPAISRLCGERRLRLVLDLGLMPMLRFRGVHAAGFADITVMAGHGCVHVWSPGLIVTFDPVLALLVERICDRDHAWLSESEAILLRNSLETSSTHDGWHRREMEQLRAELAGTTVLPWSMLPSQKGVEGVTYEAAVVFDPAASYRPGPWRRTGRDAAVWLLAKELTTSVDYGEPMPWERQGPGLGNAEPWVDLVPDTDQARFPNAMGLRSRVHVFPYQLLGRRSFADEVVAAMHKAHWWIEQVRVPEPALTGDGSASLADPADRRGGRHRRPGSRPTGG